MNVIKVIEASFVLNIIDDIFESAERMAWRFNDKVND